jgi:hypothetical protein
MEIDASVHASLSIFMQSEFNFYANYSRGGGALQFASINLQARMRH